ncbi:UDP-Gal or UDP-GlcNAc-dependent glycosyltransferase [Trypanosoma grayi]|uniref:UDP-Gal or UDP-GlcNAc-dependent glycosyltransferase n=1 Tax=Trypanosoma grayi TaxID=71804 RepID=UPI0004F44252|nr:UDP-Gal or UDP-GlcNAc-dependent glycosyltransferase [Trypanosoma grayi]KEG09207.1 UDP-Gal or UDP-GlcNAc-dependent glycosyltransferase [Trypanosoma grayi]
MKRRGSKPPITVIVSAACVTIVLLLVVDVAVTTLYYPFAHTMDTSTLHKKNNDAPLTHETPLPWAVRFIPQSTVHTWEKRDFLIAFGIPSIDISERRTRRNLQRSSCWQFQGVATKANNFTGAMVVLYVLARHPSNNYTYSAALLEEAEQWHDMVALPMNDGLPSEKKKIGDDGKWGLKAEIGMSRKTFLWFELALRLFPRARYVAKGDDDMFLRVPQYLADLRSLPRRGLYWGTVERYYKPVIFSYAYGSCYTLARDVAAQLVSFEPLQRLVCLPYNEEHDEEFMSLMMHAEDAMVGLSLFMSGYNSSLTFATEDRCSFHDVHEGAVVEPVRSSSVMIHHVNENDYKKLMKRFKYDSGASPRNWTRRNSHEINFHCWND